MLHHFVLVMRHFDEIGLNEWNVPLGLDQTVGQLLSAHPAALRKRLTPLDRETLHAAFDRHAAGSTKQSQHLRLPKIDACLDAEFQPTAHKTPQQAFVGQENLVDEIDVFDTLLLQE